MPIKIEGGGIKAYTAVVDNHGKLLTKSSAKSTLATISEEEGLAFSWTNVGYSSDAGDTILLVKNTSPNKHLHITRIAASSPEPTVAVIHFPVNASFSGTSVIAVNHNQTSGKTAEAAAFSDETVGVQGPIVGNGGLTANIGGNINTDGSMIVGTNQCIAIDFVATSTNALVTISGYYEDPEE